MVKSIKEQIMTEFDNFKKTMKKIKKFTQEECEAMEKSEAIKNLLAWQKVAHEAVKIITLQTEVIDQLYILKNNLLQKLSDIESALIEDIEEKNE
jgi:hypothetical protein